MNCLLKEFIKIFIGDWGLGIGDWGVGGGGPTPDPPPPNPTPPPPTQDKKIFLNISLLIF